MRAYPAKYTQWLSLPVGASTTGMPVTRLSYNCVYRPAGSNKMNFAARNKAKICEEFVLNLLASFADKRRIFGIHIPKTAGSHFRVQLEKKYPVIQMQFLENSEQIPENMFSIESSIKTADTICVVGHNFLIWFLENDLIRSGDVVVTTVRSPLDLMISHVNYIVTRFLADPSLGDTDTQEWARLLDITASDLVEIQKRAPIDLSHMILKHPLILHRNPICQFLGKGDSASAMDAIIQSDIEITNINIYDFWLKEKFDIISGPRVNVSEKIIHLSQLSDEEINGIDNMVSEDKIVYGKIMRSLQASGSLSIRGNSLAV
jgi:hypothetical protein